MTPERTIAIAPNLLLGLSSKADGTMLDRAIGVHDGSIVSNRTTFCQSIGVDYGDTVTSVSSTATTELMTSSAKSISVRRRSTPARSWLTR